MKFYPFIFFLFLSLFARAQDITGIWRGHFRSNESSYQRLLGEDDRYKMEVQVAQTGKKLQAVTYSYKSTIFYGKAEASGNVDPQSKKVLLKELRIVEVKMIGGDACIMTCHMNYVKFGDEEFLEGTYTSMNTRDSSNCGSGSIFLHKVPTSDFYREPFLDKVEKPKPAPEPKKTTPVAPPAVKSTPPPATKAKPKSSATAHSTKPVSKPATHNSPKPVTKQAASTKELAKTSPSIHQLAPADSVRIPEHRNLVAVPRVIANRSNELVKSITVSSPEVQLNIYDDGVVDNDTVSVYFDNKLIVSKARLTTQPITVKLRLDEGGQSTHEVVMVAENMGDIPPNTSLMVVKAGDKRWEVRIVSTDQKNAVVEFKYEKPE